MPQSQPYTPRFTHPDARVVMALNPPRRHLSGLGPAHRDQAHRDHRAAWIERRRHGLGGSDASTLIGFNRHSSLMWLYADKTDQLPPSDNDTARLGRELEPVVRARFKEATGLATRRVGMLARRDCPWMLATPDDLTSDGAGVEYKTTTERDHAHEWDETPSDHAYAQAQWYMWVTGVPHWYICVLFRDTGACTYYYVDRDEAMITIMRERAAVFWHSHVMTLTAPPVDGSEATTEAVRAMEGEAAQGSEIDCGEQAAVATRRIRRIDARIAELKRLRTETENELVRMHGPHEALKANDTVCSTYKQNGNMAYARYAKQYPERAEQYMTTKRVLDHKAALADDPVATEFVSRRLVIKTDYGDALAPPETGSESAAIAALTA